MLKKSLVLPLVIILLLVTASVAFAVAYVYQASASATAEVVTGEPGIELYKDAEATEPLSSIAFGEVAIGGGVVRDIYVENVGGDSLTRLTADSDLDYDVGRVWGSRYFPQGSEMEVGDVEKLTLELSIRDTAPEASIDFTITVRGGSLEIPLLAKEGATQEG